MSIMLRLFLFVALGCISATMAESEPVRTRLVLPTQPPPVLVTLSPFDLITPEQRDDFGSLSREKPADAGAQSVADNIACGIYYLQVRGQLEKMLGKVTSHRVVKYKTKSVDLVRPGGGMTGGVVYYLKVEIGAGRYIRENVMVGGDEGAQLSSAELDKTPADEIKEFWNANW